MSVWAAYRQLLPNRPLSKLLLGEFVSSIGDGVYLVALVVLVYAETSDPVILGIIGAGILVPKFLLSIPVGMLADRVDRRLVLLASDLGCAACMALQAFLVATDAWILPIAVVTIVAACFSTMFGPAFGALLPSLVRDESEFGPANSAWAALDNLAWVLGPAVAGALLLLGNLELAFALNAASYGFVVLVVWTLPRYPAPKRAVDAGRGRPRRWVPRLSLPPSIDAGPVGGILLLNACSWAAYGGITILMVVLAIDVFRAGPEATGYLNVALGAGGAIGALLSGVLVLRPRLSPALWLSGAAASAAIVLLGIAPALPVALIAVGVTAVGQMVLDVALITTYQRVFPVAYRGIFTGLLVTTAAAADIGGTLVVPMLVGGLGFGVVLGGVGALLFASTVVAIWLIGRAGDVAPGAFDADLRRIARLPVFRGLSIAKVEAGLRKLEPIRVGAGDVVIRQGEPADRFYVVGSGSFEVSVAADESGDVRLRTLARDSVFGERGLLTRSPRTATVTALEPGLLFAMDGEAFLELVAGRSGTAERFLALYDRPDAPDVPAAPRARA